MNFFGSSRLGPDRNAFAGARWSDLSICRAGFPSALSDEGAVSGQNPLVGALKPLPHSEWVSCRRDCVEFGHSESASGARERLECGRGLSAPTSSTEVPACVEVENREPHSRNLRLSRIKDAPATFFITKSLWPKKPALDAEARAVVVSAFRYAVVEERILLAAFVVMPDHWHGLFALLGNWTLPKLMHDLMSFVGGKTHATVRRWQTAWEDGYHDTRINSSRQFNYVRDYINQNPVRRGLVQKPEDWDASGISAADIICQQWPWGFEEE